MSDLLSEMDDNFVSLTETPQSQPSSSIDLNNNNSINNNKRDIREAGLDVKEEGPTQKKLKEPIIPIHSQWFNIEDINPIEKTSLPEFFTGNDPVKTPEMYKTIRNYMVNQFRINPDTYLTATDCRKVLTGDVCSIMKVHAFLEHWGLINYGIDPRNRPIKVNQLATEQVGNQTTIIHNYTTEGQAPTEKFYFFKALEEEPKNKEPKFTPPPTNWTDQEILRLLEGVEKFKDDWESIARHVQSRSKEECILQFLQLPIEDEFLTEQEGLDNSQYDDLPLPFADASNPIMHTVAFLSSTVSPSVAAAAAEAALNKIKEQSGLSSGDGANSTDVTSSNFDVSKLDVQTASSVALGAAASRAKEIATREEREIQRLVAIVIEKQLKKLEKKIKYFEKLESAMQKEREELEKARKALHTEKMQFIGGSSSSGK
ncbi:hypothetical protein ABK040_006695 [Willaertia magna]